MCLFDGHILYTVCSSFKGTPSVKVYQPKLAKNIIFAQFFVGHLKILVQQKLNSEIKVTLHYNIHYDSIK